MLSPKKPLFFVQWIGGFFVWFAMDLFMEFFVFEWLNWNGTTKNDWFFVLWWIGVAVWLVYGMRRLIQHPRA